MFLPRACIVAGAALMILVPAFLQGAERRVLHGHVPAAVAHLAPVDRLPGSQRLSLAIGLPLRNQEALTNLLQQIYDPTSPQYHRYLSAGQFAENFSPVAEDYQRAVSFAQTNGFKITALHPNRVLLDVNASVADIERAFQLTLRLYQHPSEARAFYAPESEPSVERSVPILDVSGLDDFVFPAPLLHKAKNPRPSTGSGPSGSYMGNDFRAAYVPGVVLKGSGQSVGLLEFDGYYANDIISYESQAGLPNVPLANVLLDSFNGSPGSANSEVALDIEMAISMAPGLSQVIVYEAGPRGIPNDILNRMATDNLAKQLSSSWIWSGGINATTDQIFKQYAAQGQSFFQASGDSDAYPGSISSQNQPVDNPFITIVGGTTLKTSGPGGAWVSESTWNWSNSGSGTSGSGGGISASYPIPSWQQGISMSANQGSTTMRNIPDVALTADDIWVTYGNGSSGSFGGTSCAAPLWAAFTALLNQQALLNGHAGIGFINPAIYALAKGTNYSALFHDITTGNNTNTGSPNRFFAVSGYDLCTGWGTPAGSRLMNALAGPAVPVIAPTNSALLVESCPNGAIDPEETVTMNFGLANVGSANTTHLVAILQTSPGVTSPDGPQAYGVLTAGGAAVSQPFSFTAHGACGGALTATLQLQDGAVNLGTVSFNLQLGHPSVGPTVSQNFDGAAGPVLPSGWTSAAVSGVQVNWVTTNGVSDSAPNSAFVRDASTAGLNELVSPPIPITSASAQLTFRHNYNLASHTFSHPRSTTYYNGGVLEIAIGNGGFTDILSAGGSFVAGVYNCTLSSGNGNMLGGRQAWGGNSGGWITTTVNLPPAAAGQNIQLRWGCGTGSNNSYTAVGWYVDTISIQDSSFSCCTPLADLALSQTASLNPAIAGQNLSYTLSIANLGPARASGVTVTDSLPSGVTFVSASPGCVNFGGSVACALGPLPSGATSNITVTVRPAAEGLITNVVTVTSTTSDPNAANNAITNAITVNAPPSIPTQPASQVVTAGANVRFTITATGTAPLGFQWLFNGTNLLGTGANTLDLDNAQADQSGIYSVIVTNMAGSTTSSVAQLIVGFPPSITQQPASLIVTQGQDAVFRLVADGDPPLNYQWRFNGTNIDGTNGNDFTVFGATSASEGNYDALVTNPFGSATSTVARLTLLLSPRLRLANASLFGANVLITLKSVEGVSYTLEYKESLTGANWTALPPAVPGTGAFISLQDTNEAPLTSRFYRVRCN